MNRTSNDHDIWSRFAVYRETLQEMVSTHPGVSALIACLALIGIVAALRCRNAQFHLLCAVIALGCLLAHSYTIARLAVHVVPSIWILAIVGTVWVMSFVGTSRWRWFVQIGFILLFGVCFWSHIQYARDRLSRSSAGSAMDPITTNVWIDPDFSEILNAIGEIVCEFDEPVWIIGEINELNPGSIELAVAQRCGVVSFVHDLEYPGRSSRSNRTAPDKAVMIKSLQTQIELHKPRTALMLRVASGSKADTVDYQNWNRWKDSAMTALATFPGVEFAERRVFSEIAITVEVYRIHPLQSPRNF